MSWLRRRWYGFLSVGAAIAMSAGCQRPVPRPVVGECVLYAGYLPERVDIMPLTGLLEGESGMQIDVYVSLLDSSGYQTRSPGIFRFEMYERVPRSSQRKGARVAIWPDIDLTEPAENSEYWRDFLRGYEFKLDFEAEAGRSYVMEITFLSPVGGGRRLSAEFEIQRER